MSKPLKNKSFSTIPGGIAATTSNLLYVRCWDVNDDNDGCCDEGLNFGVVLVDFKAKVQEPNAGTRRSK